MTNQTLELTKNLIARESVTPIDAGCQKFMTDYLGDCGFNTESMPFAEVCNFWSTHQGTTDLTVEGPVFVFAGHTDVVPAGDLHKWHTPPFEPTIKNGYLYGRGAADMKSSLAAMMVASKNFVTQHPDHKGTLAFLITSDEEGPFINGTVKVIEELVNRKQNIDYCLVGEPSSHQQLGDIIRIGRRGSLTGFLTVHGIQGHVAYPETTLNAVHSALEPLALLSNKVWDLGNENFPATSFQICKINAGSANNIVPGSCNVEFNFRFCNEHTSHELMQKVHKLLNSEKIEYELEWKLNGEPFLTPQGELVNAVCKSIQKVEGITPELSTGGGTSDGRFIAQTGAQVIELGPCNETIHKINESVLIEDLPRLARIYQNILEELLL